MTPHRVSHPLVQHRASHPVGSGERHCAAIGEVRRTCDAILPTIGLVMIGLLATCGGTTNLLADDPVESLDRELLDALEGKPPQDSPLQIIPRLIESTDAAASRLEEGRFDEDTQQLQTQILADLDALLEQATPPAQPPQNGSAAQSQRQQSQQNPPADQQQDSAQQDSKSQQNDQSDPNAAAKESEERSAQGIETQSERQRKLGLSTAAWGHLPPKVREQMRSAFSEEYLPQYDALVRQYYEALARRRAEKR